MKTDVRNYFEYLKEKMIAKPEQICLEDLDGQSKYNYKQLATQMARLQAQLEAVGVKKGDKIAVAGRNCSNWGVIFLALSAKEIITVSILPDFTGDDIRKLVEHSEAKMIFVGPNVMKKIKPEEMQGLQAAVFMDTWDMYYANDEATKKTFVETGEAFDKQYPNGVGAELMHFPVENKKELAIINYTSGTTSSPKGVMISYENLSANVDFAFNRISREEGDTLLSILPQAHMFGFMFEFLYQVCAGTHTYFLTTAPTPTKLLAAFKQVRPYMLLTVPLVIEKIVKKSVLPVIQKPMMRILWNTPGIRKVIRKKVCDKMMDAFGGQLRHLIIGGAALNKEVENALHDAGMPYLVGYGMTECAPLISYEDWYDYVPYTCGKALEIEEVRVDSEDPEHKDGEVQVRGLNVMLGYYKNEEATRAAFTEDGWLRTGDLGVIDKDGNIYLRGRSKNMILGPSGQNIYPEEIEDMINSQPMVVESVLVSREGKLVALIYPDYQAGLDEQALADKLNASRLLINKQLPSYSQIMAIELVKEEFQKTPKRSIKRFMYK